ncbi:MAG: SbcC/MukB-like Walker B domain-containing protein, partial [Steroidobacteraceae bacterium]
ALAESQGRKRDVAMADLTRAETALSARLARVVELRGDYTSVADRVVGLTRRRACASGYVSVAAQLAVAIAAADASSREVEPRLTERGFTSRDEAEDAHRPVENMTRLGKEIETYDARLAAVTDRLAEPQLQGLPADPVDVETPTAALAAARADRDDAMAARARLVDRCRQLTERVAEATGKVGAVADRNRVYEELRGLADAIDGKGSNTRRMDLETFVLAARLEEIVAVANVRLLAMTSGRYTLEHDDSLAYRGAASGLGLEILDGYTGLKRQPVSLSGGETFLASLALALGLADVVTGQSGGITLETMFVDEGFGSLDPQTLEIAMSTLDGLRAGGRTVGLISHVDAMKERIPVGLQVVVMERGDSEIRSG